MESVTFDVPSHRLSFHPLISVRSYNHVLICISRCTILATLSVGAPYVQWSGAQGFGKIKCSFAKRTIQILTCASAFSQCRLTAVLLRVHRCILSARNSSVSHSHSLLQRRDHSNEFNSKRSSDFFAAVAAPPVRTASDFNFLDPCQNNSPSNSYAPEFQTKRHISCDRQDNLFVPEPHEKQFILRSTI